MSKRGFRLGVATLLLTALPILAPAAGRANTPIGQAEKIVNGVFGGNLAYPVKVAQPVSRDEQINTASDAAARFTFEDGTSLDLGADAQVVLDDLVYQPGTGLAGVMRIGKGMARFVGSSRPKDVVVRLPVGSVGVRGTVFVVLVTSQFSELRIVEGTPTLTVGVVTQTLAPGDFIRIEAAGGPVATRPGPAWLAAERQLTATIGALRVAARPVPVAPTSPTPQRGGTTLADAQGRVVGHLLFRDGGRIDALDTRNTLRAIYDPARDVTIDPQGRVLGAGNQLARVMGAAPR
jgi:hypothetical protein